MSLTDAQKDAYLKNSGACPFCGSSNIYGLDNEFKLGKIYYGLICSNCKKRWDEIYTLSGIEEVV